MEQNSGEIFSLWVGPYSQELAHHFYALQAQQFFNEQQDPLEHSCLWKLYDNYGQRKKPYFLTFDTQIPHLNHLRQISHEAMLKQMEKQTLAIEQTYFPMEYQMNKQSQTKQKLPEQKDKYLFQRWESSESHYVTVDSNFVYDCDAYDFWRDVYKRGEDTYEERVRKQLEYFDYLKVFTVASDRERVGFTQEILTYLKDQCPKKSILYFDITGKSSSQENDSKGKSQANTNLNNFSTNNLTVLAQINPLITQSVTLDVSLPKYQFFTGENPYTHLAPVLSCIMTPFVMKKSNMYEYFSNILPNPSRNIFDVAYTLPIIGEKLQLSPETNIFQYLTSEEQYQKKMKLHSDQMQNKQRKENKEKKQKAEDTYQQEPKSYVNRINFTSDYVGLSLKTEQKYKNSSKFSLKRQINNLSSGLLAESFILKGHVADFKHHFAERTAKSLELRYLEGIFSNYQGNQVRYDPFYKKYYGAESVVESYPFHTIMFQHEKFSLHFKTVASQRHKLQKHQMQEQWKDNVLDLAGRYQGDRKAYESDSD